jgi:Fe-S cluster assembly ATP-binding protein
VTSPLPEPLLEVRNLKAEVNETPILRGIDLVVRPGEVHAIMGPNGSGKSTLAKVLVGHPAFTVTGGEARYLGEDLLGQEPEARARNGIFMAFQYPVEVPGVNNADFLRMAYNAKIRHENGANPAGPQKDELDPLEFADFLAEKATLVEMDPDLVNNRSVNAGFSGGEKKRNEILQMAVLEPRLALLDETDSGLDIDALRIVANGVNRLRHPDRAMVLVTHYQRLLNYIVPDYVHVLAEGRIIRSGGKELALELEEKGYDWLLESLGSPVPAVAKGNEQS